MHSTLVYRVTFALFCLTACSGDKDGDTPQVESDSGPIAGDDASDDSGTDTDTDTDTGSGTKGGTDTQDGSDTADTADTGGDEEPDAVFTCTLTAPADGSVHSPETKISFTGQISHPDEALEAISVSWTTDDGSILGTGSPDSTGAVSLVTSELTLGSYIVTMTATDSSEQGCSAQVSITVGEAPALELYRPSSGEVVDYEDPVRFQAVVTDDQPVSELSLSWESDLDGVFSTEGPDGKGFIIFEHSSLSLGLHTITATATDRQGLQSSAGVILYVLKD